ncbi:hypothetical protein KIN20_031286 [Parelaphostrongylus tenuis]|uniref:Uncharacterized protein n=1 Tax=Parelaphostrongylus tenuis TaxID=148309 RepID=A0AAD5WGQ3_PARTN|nr:hypothetical protein KIN20_031286 [Parelaphostrongylus tenuis]
MAESYLSIKNTANVYAQGNDANAMNGECAGVEIDTLIVDREKAMAFTMRSLNNEKRELIMIAATSFYSIRICVVNAAIFVEFSSKILQITDDYNLINVFTDNYTITAKMNMSMYDLLFTKDQILIRCPAENIMLRISSSGVNVYMDQLSRLQIDRGGGEISLGDNVINAELIEVTSLSCEVSLSSTGLVTANTVNSEIVVQTPVQNVRMTSAHHVIRVKGGIPHFITNSGKVCIEVKSAHGLPHIDGLLPQFVMPPDQFANIGPKQAALLTTQRPSSTDSSLLHVGLLDGAFLQFNETDRCVLCINQTANVSTTRLPTKIVPTFPPYLSYSNNDVSIFPTLISNLTALTTIETDSSSMSSSTETGSSYSDSAVFSTVATQPTFTTTTTAENVNIFYPTTTLPTTVSVGFSATVSATVRLFTESSQSTHTPDQFVIGQYGDIMSTVESSESAEQLYTVTTIPTELHEMLSTASVTTTSLSRTDDFLTPDTMSRSDISLNENNSSSATKDDFQPLPSSLSLTDSDQSFNVSLDRNGSWETETLFPVLPSTLSQTKPSVLVLKMKMPSKMDFKSFDLTRNLTSSLSEVVRQSMLRVKRGKRSLPERFLRDYLVKVHRIERIGNSMNVIFSINETDVDSRILEDDLYSLDFNYLTRFLAFPVLSTITRTHTNSHLNFVIIGILSFSLSIAFLCILFRSVLKELAKMFLVKINRCFSVCRQPERVTSITIVTDETFTP